MANPTHKGGKVLKDLTIADAPTAAPIVAASEVVGKRKKNTNIKIEYIAGDGALSPSPTEDVKGFQTTTPRGVKTVLFADLPASILLQMAAFGGNTVYRNEFNTTLNTQGGTVDDADDALQTRHDGFMRGEWRATGDGSGSLSTPLRITAIKRAYLNAGKTEEQAEGYFQKALGLYRALATKELKAAQLKAWGTKGSIVKAENQIKLEAMQAKIAGAKPATDDLEDLVD